MNPLEHAHRVRHNDWYGFRYPSAPQLPPKPWHPDGDRLLTTQPTRKVENSDRIISHVASSGKLNIHTGSVKPDYVGKVDGVYINVARSTDPVFTVSRTDGSNRLSVTTGYSAPYGAKVRIGSHMIPQGYPMNEYSDHKLHVYDAVTDPNNPTLTEIQYIIDVKRNPALNWILSLFGRGNGYQCHGVVQYPIHLSSTHRDVKGSTAARIPNIESELLYDELQRGWRQMSTCSVPAAAKAPRFKHPARNSDGQSDSPDAVMMGQILKLSRDAYLRLLSSTDYEFARAVFECWYLFGIMVIDTGLHVSFGVQPDARIDQDKCSVFGSVRITDFEVWEI
jgi:hypothetical protein